ncbi:MAG: DUF3854 domain-containing protein [Dehalococcoidia bacterium]|nr:DUF3854 domain-containing protein [Dehalococcoidia bacterium]
MSPQNEGRRERTGGQANGKLSGPSLAPGTPEVNELTQAHLDHLETGSGISPEVIAERGYRTIYGPEAPELLGFSKNQRRAGILIPLHAPDGSPAGCQFKPDSPRTGTNGKPVKYETPAAGRLRVDMPPRCRKDAGNPGVPLFITEGAKKADKLASHGLCAINLAGVWSFKGKNEWGGVTLLADWHYLTVKDRIVYIAYDSDVAVKSEVKKAMDRLAEHLKRKGAQVQVINLPQNGQVKTGVDDYFLAHSVDELTSLAAPLEETKQPASQEIPGFHLADGTLAEMVITADGRAFAIHTGTGDVKIMSEYRDGNTVYKPTSDNLASQVVSFAGGVAPYGSLGQLLSEVRRFTHTYVELPPNYEAIASLYVLLTWVHDYLSAVPYLRALGDCGTGKTRFLEVLGAVCFRSITAGGATSASPIFRILDKYGGTLVMDEADYEKSDAQQEVIKILNSGYKPGSPVLKSESVGGKNWEPRGYRVFGPKVIATRYRFKDKTLESRCLTHETQGLTRDDMPLVLGARFRAEAFGLRAKLLSFRLEHLPVMARLNLEDARPQGNLEPRLQEIILPMKALAQGDTELEKTLAEFIGAMQAQITAERRNSLPALVLEAILALHHEGSELSAKAIASKLNAEDGVKEHLQKPELGITPERVAKIVRGALQLKMELSSSSANRRSLIVWAEKRIDALRRRYCLVPENNPSHPSLERGTLHPNPSLSQTTLHSEARPFTFADNPSPGPRLEQARSEGREEFEELKQGMEGPSAECEEEPSLPWVQP